MIAGGHLRRPQAVAAAGVTAIGLGVGVSVAQGGSGTAILWLAGLGAFATLAFPRVAFFGLVAILPLDLHIRSGFVLDSPLDSLRLLIFMALVARGAWRGRRSLWWPVGLCLGVYLLAVGLSVVNEVLGLHIAILYNSWRTAFKLLTYIAFGISGLMVLRDGADLRRAYWLLVAGLAISSAYAIYQYRIGDFGRIYHLLYPLNDATPWAGRPPGLLNYANSAAGYINLLLPIIAVVTFTARTMGTRMLSGATLVLGLVALLVTQSRGGWLATAVMMFLVFIRAVPALIRLPSLMVLGGAVYLALFQIPFTVQRIQALSGSDLHNREALWKAALALFSLSPAVGVGIGSYQDLYHAQASLSAYFGDPQIQAHQLYLQVLAETGILGFTAFMGLLATVAVRGWRGHILAIAESDSIRTGFTFGAVIAIVGVMVHGLVDVLFQASPQFAGLFWLLVLIAGSARVASRAATVAAPEPAELALEH